MSATNIKNIFLDKNLRYWNAVKLESVITQFEVIHNNNQEKYEKYLKIIDKRKNYNLHVEECMKEVWINTWIPNKNLPKILEAYLIWREFVENFEYSERILIVNEIRRRIAEKLEINKLNAALSASKESDTTRNLQMKRLNRQIKTLEKELKKRDEELEKYKVKINQLKTKLNELD
jgi:hypothetical protein